MQARIDPIRQVSCRLPGYDLCGGVQQILGSAGQDDLRLQNSDPGSRTGGGATLGLVVAEARPSSQVTPVGAGQVTAIGVGNCRPKAVANSGCRQVVLTRTQACRWPGLVSSTTHGS